MTLKVTLPNTDPHFSVDIASFWYLSKCSRSTTCSKRLTNYTAKSPTNLLRDTREIVN